MKQIKELPKLKREAELFSITTENMKKINYKYFSHIGPLSSDWIVGKSKVPDSYYIGTDDIPSWVWWNSYFFHQEHFPYLDEEEGLGKCGFVKKTLQCENKNYKVYSYRNHDVVIEKGNLHRWVFIDDTVNENNLVGGAVNEVKIWNQLLLIFYGRDYDLDPNCSACELYILDLKRGFAVKVKKSIDLYGLKNSKMTEKKLGEKLLSILPDLEKELEKLAP